MSQLEIDVPEVWTQLEIEELRGVFLIIGATDTGKSTFARFLFQRLQNLGRNVAFLDGDPGQSTLGPPTTITLAIGSLEEGETATQSRIKRYFIGSTSPQGHMLPTIVGGAKLVQHAREIGAEVVVYDTSGLIDPQQGGLALKNAKIELLHPSAVFTIQRGQELEPLLIALRRSRRTRVFDISPSPFVVRRDQSTRREYRSRCYSQYFQHAQPLVFDWTGYAVFPLPLFRIHRLVALEDVDGFTLGLGIVLEINRISRQLTLLTPLGSMDEVNALRLGDILLNPVTFHDERIV